MDVCLLQTIIEVNDKNKFNIIVNLAATRAITPSGYDEALKFHITNLTQPIKTLQSLMLIIAANSGIITPISANA